MPNKIEGDLRLVWLEAFVATADLRSYSLAGRRLATGQSNITRYVQSLEAWLRRPLVIGSRPVQLTPDGVNFLPIAKQAIALLEGGRAKLPTAVEPDKPKISPKDLVIKPGGSDGGD